MSYYIDGTIESIEITTAEKQPLQFSVIPSSDCLKTVAEGEIKALFIMNADKMKESWPAILEKVSKNESGKEKLDFTTNCVDSALKCLLLEAKNNRNTVRVFANATGGTPEDLKIDFGASVSITIL